MRGCEGRGVEARSGGVEAASGDRVPQGRTEYLMER